MVVYANNYCEQFCKNVSLFGTSWDVRCDRTDLINNKEYQSNADNRTCITYRYEDDCLHPDHCGARADRGDVP